MVYPERHNFLLFTHHYILTPIITFFFIYPEFDFLIKMYK